MTTQIEALRSGEDWRWRSPQFLILLVPAAARFLLHLLYVGGWGLHGDELYYLACSEHLDWGYVDQPPLSLFLLHLQRAMFGDSMLSIRFLPALCGFFTVLLSGLLARRMGAALFGQLLSEICAFFAPVYLAVNHFFSMNAFDLLFWIMALYLIVCIIDGGKPVLWVWFGVVVGLGFENKISVLFLCFGLAVGLLLTKERRVLFTKWILPAGLVAILLMLPHLLWQISYGWPTLEWIANARAHKMVSMSLPAYLFEQIMLIGPLSVLVWGTGLLSLLFYPALARYRPLGVCYLVILAVFVLQGGKPYYLAPIYPILFGAGAIVIERWIAGLPLRIALCVILFVSGVVTVPMGMPVLSVEEFVKYQNTLGLRPSSAERIAEGKLPSFFASMIGNDKIVVLVDSVYRSLPAEDRGKCGIFCENYSLAGAIDFYGRDSGLPRAICTHNSYWLWGMHGYTGEVLIVVGSNAASLGKYFGDVSVQARFRNEYVQPMYDNLPVFVVRKPKQPIPPLWPGLKHYR
jgi:hypothetical protein